MAYREANAIALFGDAPRARAALQRAERAAADLDDDGTSAWSFSRQRQAIFALSVCLHTADPDSALRAAATADAYWDTGAAKVTATWAQVRAGAAMAHLLKNSIDGAAAQLAPVLELPRSCASRPSRATWTNSAPCWPRPASPTAASAPGSGTRSANSMQPRSDREDRK